VGLGKTPEIVEIRPQVLSDQCDDGAARKGVGKGLKKPVADHALGLGSDDVEGVGLGQLRVVRALHGEEANLWTVAVGDDEFVVAGHVRQLRDGVLYVMTLHGSGGLFRHAGEERCRPARRRGASQWLASVATMMALIV